MNGHRQLQRHIGPEQLSANPAALSLSLPAAPASEPAVPGERGAGHAAPRPPGVGKGGCDGSIPSCWALSCQGHRILWILVSPFLFPFPSSSLPAVPPPRGSLVPQIPRHNAGSILGTVWLIQVMLELDGGRRWGCGLAGWLCALGVQGPPLHGGAAEVGRSRNGGCSQRLMRCRVCRSCIGLCFKAGLLRDLR